MSIDKITKELVLITKELDRLKKVENLLNQLLEEETVKSLSNYEYIHDRYGQKGATRVSTSTVQLSNKPKPEFVDSIYAPKWAQGSDKTYKKNINNQSKLAKSSTHGKITINKKHSTPTPTSNIKWINPKKEEVINKFEYDDKQYLIYKGDLFDVTTYKYAGSISGGKITISEKDVSLSNTEIVELEQLPDSDYYKCTNNFAYQLINGLANRIGEIRDGEDIYAYQ